MPNDRESSPGILVVVGLVAVAGMILLAVMLGLHFFTASAPTPVGLGTAGGGEGGSARQVPDNHAGATPPAGPAALPSEPAGSSGTVVWLGGNFGNGRFDVPGQITQEIYRQAFLIAARDELSLQTRDESLREWDKLPDHSHVMRMLFEHSTAFLIDMGHAKTRLWQRRMNRDEPDRYLSMIRLAEALSRTSFVDVLRNRGWVGQRHRFDSAGKPPADAEQLLGQLDEFSQFKLLRETHAQIAAEGESMARLGVLVRAYANLGQLCRYHWSLEYPVYTARSLIYAQRMVARDPQSPVALRHRAYALALAGFPNDAINDLSAANASAGGAAPEPWAEVIDAFCQYQPSRLTSLADANPAIRPLASYLAMVSVENTVTNQQIIARAESALAASPNCFRAFAVEATSGGLPERSRLEQAEPKRFSDLLGAIIPTMPGLSAQTQQEISDAKQLGQYPQSRLQVCDALFEQGAPGSDTTEPSLSALARMIQEVTFAQLYHYAWNESFAQSNEVIERLTASDQLYDDHPFAFLLHAYESIARLDRDQARHTLSDHPWVMTHLTASMIDLELVDQTYDVQGNNGTDETLRWLNSYTDDNAFDLQHQAAMYLYDPGEGWLANQMKYLSRVAPKSPFLCVWNIKAHWDAAKAKDWESWGGDFPIVLTALAQKYESQRQWADAARCYAKYVAISPDRDGYERLAQLYGESNRPDLQIATYKRMLQLPEQQVTEHAADNMQIAWVYMSRGDYAAALPYADVAAQCGWGQELSCDAVVNGALGHFDKADQLFAAANQAGLSDAFWWYSYCVHTGHGDRAAAMRAMADYVKQPWAPANDCDLELASMDVTEGRYADAIAAVEHRMPAHGGPLWQTFIAILADRSGDLSTRDKFIDQACSPNWATHPTGRFAALARDMLRAGPHPAVDSLKLQEILKDAANDSDRQWMVTMLALILEGHGQHDSAKALLLAHSIINPASIARPIADGLLRGYGVDPSAVTTQPATSQ